MSSDGVLGDVAEKLKSLGGNWASYSVLGSFLLYVLGYLTIRFYLTAFGIAIDLAVLDERYVFAGAKFLVYVVSAVSTVVMLWLLIGAVGYLPYRLVTRNRRADVAQQASRWQRFCAWVSQPERLSLAGIVFSVAVIQLFMKQCFFFSNLLLRTSFPREPQWLAGFLLAENENSFELYFSGLIVATLISLALLLLLRNKPRPTSWSSFLFWVFAFLVTAQTLLLPVNYGYLLAHNDLPKVATIDGDKPLKPNEEAWLVWEGKEGLSFLVRRKDGDAAVRSLVTLKQKDVKRTEIIGYSRILRELFVKP